MHRPAVVADENRGLARQGQHLVKRTTAQVQKTLRRHLKLRRGARPCAPGHTTVGDILKNQSRQLAETAPFFFCATTVRENHKALLTLTLKKRAPWKFRRWIQLQGNCRLFVQSECARELLQNRDRMMRPRASGHLHPTREQARSLAAVMPTPLHRRSRRGRHQAGAQKPLHVPHDIEVLRPQPLHHIPYPAQALLAIEVNHLVDERRRLDQGRKAIARDPSDLALGKFSGHLLQHLQGMHDVSQRGGLDHQQTLRGMNNRSRGHRQKACLSHDGLQS